MTQHDIDVVIAQFALAAKLASQAGFQGVELNAGRKKLAIPALEYTEAVCSSLTKRPQMAFCYLNSCRRRATSA